MSEGDGDEARGHAGTWGSASDDARVYQSGANQYVIHIHIHIAEAPGKAAHGACPQAEARAGFDERSRDAGPRDARARSTTRQTEEASRCHAGVFTLTAVLFVAALFTFKILGRPRPVGA